MHFNLFLQELEEELESHITRVTEVALREAENKYREENERIRSELEVELAELRARVSIMNKVSQFNINIGLHALERSPLLSSNQNF